MKSMNQLISKVITALLLLCFSPAPAAAQQPISIEHEYLHILRWQNHLDKVAAEHEKQGKDGAWLRTALQKQLRFTDKEFDPIRESAGRLIASLAAVDVKAKPIVAIYRAKRASGPLSAQDRAAAHAQLKPLQAEREGLIAAEIAHLNANLGPDLAARLRAFIEASQRSASSPEAQQVGTTAIQGSKPQ